MKLITSDHVVYQMSAANAPVASAASGEVVTFQTLDCFENQICNESQLLSGIDWDHINPATGPLFVEDARPGDILKVEILDIRIAAHGTMTATPGEGAVGSLLTAEKTKIIPVSDGKAHFSETLDLDICPMIGVIGTAPANGQKIATGTPGSHGGNMDNRRISKGAILYLPVNVEGALLAMGDLHALMSDGEVLICGLEIPGEVEVRVSVIKDFQLPLPMVCVDDDLITVASAPTLDEAALDATHHMMQLITEHTTIDPQEAGMLLSLKGELRICQIVDPMKTARMEFPLHILTAHGFRLP
ncbi:MAG: acetamidase/formamidase family protein [Clostridiales bacterium]|nr:acetamidase/formamidase family protein [Clostridiales bacterium]